MNRIKGAPIPSNWKPHRHSTRLWKSQLTTVEGFDRSRTPFQPKKAIEHSDFDDATTAVAVGGRCKKRAIMCTCMCNRTSILMCVIAQPTTSSIRAPAKVRYPLPLSAILLTLILDSIDIPAAGGPSSATSLLTCSPAAGTCRARIPPAQ